MTELLSHGWQVVVFMALWFLLNFCGIFSSSSCDSCINMFIMQWAACWCAFCASLNPDSSIICLCLFLHVTMNLVTHCAPFSAATRHGALLVQPQVTLNCVHSSVSDEAYNCLHPWVQMYRQPWPVLHQRSALVLSGSASWSLPDLSPQRTQHLRSFFP